jgi:predicted nucleotidyltransferase
MKLHLTCKESADLIVARADRALTRRERLALRLHLWMCRNCPEFERQMELIRRMLHKWKPFRDEQP